jgi:hypothetical protein
MHSLSLLESVRKLDAFLMILLTLLLMLLLSLLLILAWHALLHNVQLALESLNNVQLTCIKVAQLW